MRMAVLSETRIAGAADSAKGRVALAGQGDPHRDACLTQESEHIYWAKGIKAIRKGELRMPDLIQDYITGKQVRAYPEELVRQELEQVLVDELGYPKERIAVEFPIQRGSRSGRRSESADIAVFRSNKHDQKNLYIIVEAEPPGHPLDNQLFSYVTATTAEFAVWSDGLIPKKSKGPRYWWRDLKKDPTTFVEIPALPRFGESLDEIGKYKKSQLSPVKNIRALFQKMHNRLYGEGPLKREDDIAQEVIKVLFCKLFDELSPGETCQFRATVTELDTLEGRTAIGNRVRSLFEQLKSDPSYSGMFEDETLRYDDYWISYIVSELQPFGLTHDQTDTDAMGDAYEVFVGPQLKGESGQFFTPRSIVRLAVDMTDPNIERREQVIDPACGSGGFLIHVLNSVRRQLREKFPDRSDNFVAGRFREYANNFIAGIDIEDLLFRVARSYMAVVGDGKAGIFREDSLASPTDWRETTKARIQLEQFDVLLTNPPFGTKIKIESSDILEQFDLACPLKEGERAGEPHRGGQDPAILFLERSLQLLKRPTGKKAGGRLAIDLPRQILSGHDRAMVEIRRWLLRRVRILAVVDMPPEAFQPYTGTITSVVFAERAEAPLSDDYTVFMAIANSVGHDRRGNPSFRRSADGLLEIDDDGRPIPLDDLPRVANAYREYSTNGFKPPKDRIGFCVNIQDILNEQGLRLDAWYYDPTKNDVVKKVWDLDGRQTKDGPIVVKTIGELVADPSDIFYPGRHKRNYCPPGPDAVPFLSGTNILQARPFDVKWQPRNYGPVSKHLVQKNTILVTRSGSTGRAPFVRGDIAGFPVKDGVAVSEHVIRIVPDQVEVDPGYLFAYLSSDSTGRVLLDKGIYASVVKHITPDHIRAIPVPLPPRSVQRRIGDKVRVADRRRSTANRGLREAQSEIAALAE